MGMDADGAAARELAELVIQLGRAAYAEGAGGTLTAAQWTALRFFARANRFSRTVSAFADYHATTRGTASQTVKSLVAGGYLSRHRCERDGRSTRFELTPSARALLGSDPLNAVVRAAGRLKPAQCAALAGGLRRVQGWLAEDQGRVPAGGCGLCGHLGRDADGPRCCLMNESLAETELSELCARFRPADSEAPSP